MAVGAPDAAFHTFLDRLMGAESAGRSHAKNPRSSALGPFQFINSTFLAVMRRAVPRLCAAMLATGEASPDRLYASLPPVDFSRAVLATRPTNLAVLPVEGV